MHYHCTSVPMPMIGQRDNLNRRSDLVSNRIALLLKYRWNEHSKKLRPVRLPAHNLRFQLQSVRSAYLREYLSLQDVPIHLLTRRLQSALPAQPKTQEPKSQNPAHKPALIESNLRVPAGHRRQVRIQHRNIRPGHLPV
jgi:hypothetical protein